MTFGVYLECYSLTSATSEDARMFLYTTTTDCAFYPQSHKMSLNKKNLPRSRILGTFINDFSKLFCVCWRKKECVKRFSKMFWLNRSLFTPTAKVLFTDHCRWQNVPSDLLPLVNNCVEFSYKTEMTGTKASSSATVDE